MDFLKLQAISSNAHNFIDFREMHISTQTINFASKSLEIERLGGNTHFAKITVDITTVAKSTRPFELKLQHVS